MRNFTVIAAIILMLMITACSAMHQDMTEMDFTTETESQQADDIVLSSWTDSDLSSLIRNNTTPPSSPNDIEPEENDEGFPTDLVNDIRFTMYQYGADYCIDEIENQYRQDFLITREEFFSMVDMSHEETMSMLDVNKPDYVFCRIDTNGDGIEELIAFEDTDQNSYSYIYMLAAGVDGYTYIGIKNIENVRSYSFFQYENYFYLAASCENPYTGIENLKIYLLNYDIFDLYNLKDTICFDWQFGIPAPTPLYRNESYADISMVQDYLNEIVYDVVYANRDMSTFYGDELECRSNELSERAMASGIEIWEFYQMDINNDGNEEIFSKEQMEYEQPFMHSFTWYNENLEQITAPVSLWNDEQYCLNDMWFKNINGKTITFTLYSKIDENTNYIIDARIHEDSEAMILFDYIIELEPINIRTSQSCYMTDISIYKLLQYNDPALDIAFPDDLTEIAKDLRLQVQGSVENNEDGKGAVSDVISETYAWKKIYDNHASYEAEISEYLESIKEELMDTIYHSSGKEIFTGDETTEFEADKLLRLKSVRSSDDTYYKIDFNNDQQDEYILKHAALMGMDTSVQQFTEKGIIILEYDDTVRDFEDELIQMWFKKIDGKVFTFRMYRNEESSSYLLNISLIEDTQITQVQTHIIVPENSDTMSE